MTPAVRRSAYLILGAVFGVAGCGGSAADNAARQDMAQATAALDQKDLTTADSAADAAVATDGISPEVDADAHLLSGQIKLQRAQQIITQAQDSELTESRLLGQIRLATIQVQSALAQIKSQQGLDPSPVQEQLRAKIAQARGGQDDLFWKFPTATEGKPQPDQDAPLGSLFGLDSQISRLQSQIQDNRTQAQALLQQKTALAEQADEIQQKSVAETGQQSVDDEMTAAQTRRKAADLGAQIDQIDSALVPLQADLALAQSQRAGVQKAIDDYQQQITDLDDVWKTVQQTADVQKAAIAAIAGPASEASKTPTTIADECAQLATLAPQVRALRDQAADLLKGAVTDFNAAARSCDLLRADWSDQNGPRTPPGEQLALQQLGQTYSGPAARLRAADAERALALNYAAEAMIANQINQALGQIKDALGPDAPAAVDQCLAANASPAVSDLAALADEQFKNALDHYDSLAQVSSGPGKTAAMVGKMIAAFGAKQLSLVLGGKPVADQTPDALQSTINDMAKNVADSDPTMLPAIPYTIAATPSDTGGTQQQ